MLGSSVLPDLLETMHSVLFRSSFASIDLICTGSVESSTCRSGKPLIFPKVLHSTSGQRLDPPIPSSNACLKRAFCTSSAIRLKASTCESCWSTICSQPSHLLSSVRVQRDASFCQSPATLWFFRHSSSEAAAALASSSGNVQVCRFTLTHGLPRFSPRHR